jgi:D-lactate dehydrogenase
MVKVAVFDTKPFTKSAFTACDPKGISFTFFEHRLTPDTVASAIGFKVVCCFVNDMVNAAVVERLKDLGVELIALRCAGYNNVDLAACDKHGISLVRVPAYSPHSVAEHGVALMLALNRHITRAHARVREGNFSLEGLVGFEMHGKTAGIIGTGRIGKCAAEMLLGFGCRILAHDPSPNADLAKRSGVAYTDLDTLFRQSDIISLYAPLVPATRYLINDGVIAKMKRGVMLINTSRGALVDTRALIRGLKNGKIGSAGLDVYEEESEYFFEDYSDAVIADDVLARLLTFHNVLITSHQAFLTKEALTSIAQTTVENIQEFLEGKREKELTNSVCVRCG